MGIFRCAVSLLGCPAHCKSHLRLIVSLIVGCRLYRGTACNGVARAHGGGTTAERSVACDIQHMLWARLLEKTAKDWRARITRRLWTCIVVLHPEGLCSSAWPVHGFLADWPQNGASFCGQTSPSSAANGTTGLAGQNAARQTR